MFQARLAELRDFIKTNNPYYDIGYDRVWQDQTLGHIYQFDSSGANEGKKIFPADNEGNFFYLRAPNAVGFENNPIMAFSECRKALSTVGDIICVAACRKSSPDAMLQNLIQTIETFDPRDIMVVRALFQTQDVILQELARIKPDNINKALQNSGISDYSIVSLTFRMKIDFNYLKDLSCLPNPCISC